MLTVKFFGCVQYGPSETNAALQFAVNTLEVSCTKLILKLSYCIVGVSYSHILLYLVRLVD